MSQFVLLDPLLRFVGGHNFEYDVQLLHAAEDEGWRPVLATDRGLEQRSELDTDWDVYRAFHVRDPDYGLASKVQQAERRFSALKRTWKRFLPVKVGRYWFRQRRYWRRWRASLRRFDTAMETVWAGCQPGPGDQIFLATALPYDIAALSHWTRQNRVARDVQWHLQMHFPLVDTKTWYSRTSRNYDDFVIDLAGPFEELMRSLPRGHVHWYATTEALADQLSYLLGEPFQSLHYFSHPTLANVRRDVPPPTPLRVRCGGEARPDKGAENWPPLLDALWNDYLSTGRVQLALQTRPLDQLPDCLTKVINLSDAAAADGGPVSLTRIPWPLSQSDYLRFLTESDVGLLMYDPMVYHVRCSGVQVEMLSAGVPVIVPAGCWLADQISEPIFAHQERLRDELPVVASLTTAELEWHVSPAALAVARVSTITNLDADLIPAAVAQTSVPRHASHLLLLLTRDEPNLWNHYVAVVVRQYSDTGEIRQTSRDVISPRTAGKPATVLVPLDRQTRTIELRLQSALGCEPVVLRRVECCFLAAAGAASPPRGAVGLVASSPQQFAQCVRDVIENYDHYARSSREFAVGWAPRHTAAQVLSDLTERAGVPISAEKKIRHRRAA